MATAPALVLMPDHLSLIDCPVPAYAIDNRYHCPEREYTARAPTAPGVFAIRTHPPTEPTEWPSPGPTAGHPASLRPGRGRVARPCSTEATQASFPHARKARPSDERGTLPGRTRPTGPGGRLPAPQPLRQPGTHRQRSRRFQGRFARQVDPDGILPEGERQRRAERARKAYYAALAAKSARARRLRHQKKRS